MCICVCVYEIKEKLILPPKKITFSCTKAKPRYIKLTYTYGVLERQLVLERYFITVLLELYLK